MKIRRPGGLVHLGPARGFARFVPFTSPDQARSFLDSQVADDPERLDAIRRMVLAEIALPDGEKLSDDDVLKHAADLLADHRWRVQELRRPGSSPAEVIDAPAARPLPTEGPRAWTVTPTLEPEYKVVLLCDPKDPHPADPTFIDLIAVHSEGELHRYRGDGKLTRSLDNVEVFRNQRCTVRVPFEGSTALIGNVDLQRKKLRLWLRGTRPGPFELTFELDGAPQHTIEKDGTETQKMGVVELKLGLHCPEPPDAPPKGWFTRVVDFIKGLFTTQPPLDDVAKKAKGGLVHVQNEESEHGRIKLVVPPLVARDWPGGTEDYQVVLSVAAVSGKVELYTEAAAGERVDLPVAMKRSELTAERVFWVQGQTNTVNPRQLRLELGLNRQSTLHPPGDNAPKHDGDWVALTVAGALVAWNQKEAYCGDSPVVHVATRCFPDGTRGKLAIAARGEEPSEPIQDLAIDKQLDVAWVVKNVVFAADDPDEKELIAALIAGATRATTERESYPPLKVKRVPDTEPVTQTHHLVGEGLNASAPPTQYGWQSALRIGVSKDRLTVVQRINAVKGWKGMVVEMKADTDGIAGWYYLKKVGLSYKCHNGVVGAPWWDLPHPIDTYSKRTRTVVFRVKDHKYKAAEWDHWVWPEAFADHGGAFDQRKKDWEGEVQKAWHDKLEVVHKGCQSDADKRCRWGIDVDFKWVDDGGDFTVYVVASPDGGRSNARDWYLSADKNVGAHEAGHLLGAYDEYNGGANDKDDRVIDSGSIMGTGLSVAKPRHFANLAKWAAKVMSDATGRKWELEVKNK